MSDSDSDHADIIDELEALHDRVDPETREQVDELMEQITELQPRGRGNVIVGFDRTDLSEAAIGSLVFGIPMFVEGGTNEVGAYLAARPLQLLATVALAVAVVYGIVYVADFQDVRVHQPIFGIVPRRMVGICGITFLMAGVALTGWGRIEWASPLLALATTTVAFVPMSIGAALGDILPGS
ncbi:MAG: DUF2391 family protein [Halobacteriales archaeon]|nr:DUF2391 family protein [Halobacteriales archaeon]